MKVLVTGGTGFLGRWVLDRLLELGIGVRAMVRDPRARLPAGVEAVEVSVDGVWYPATLPAQDTIDTWRQWYYTWNAAPGTHVLQVRATDETGYTQTAIVHKTEPNGATGYHTIKVTVR